MTDPDRPDNVPVGNGRFTTQAHAVEDRLKADTVGLVQLSDFRKRRAEAFEAAQDTSSGGSTPHAGGTGPKAVFKKKKKGVKAGGLSFGDDEENDDVAAPSIPRARPKTQKADAGESDDSIPAVPVKRAFKPNAAVALLPKAQTKSALLREAHLKDALRKEYTQLQEAVKATEFLIPFVFYSGKNIPGGVCRVKKGDFVWLFLERARKVGAGLTGLGEHTRKDWARISVDDLMVVKGDVIIPHHYDFHFFIVDRKIGYNGPLFPYSAEPTSATPKHLLPDSSASLSAAQQQAGLLTAAQRAEQAAAVPVVDDSELEGFDDDPGSTKVVDRRWYERNKHVFPASTWEEYDPTKDYSTAIRKDALGNAMFFSR